MHACIHTYIHTYTHTHLLEYCSLHLISFSFFLSPLDKRGGGLYPPAVSLWKGAFGFGFCFLDSTGPAKGLVSPCCPCVKRCIVGFEGHSRLTSLHIYRVFFFWGGGLLAHRARIALRTTVYIAVSRSSTAAVYTKQSATGLRMSRTRPRYTSFPNSPVGTFSRMATFT